MLKLQELPSSISTGQSGLCCACPAKSQVGALKGDENVSIKRLARIVACSAVVATTLSVPFAVAPAQADAKGPWVVMDYSQPENIIAVEIRPDLSDAYEDARTQCFVFGGTACVPVAEAWHTHCAAVATTDTGGVGASQGGSTKLEAEADAVEKAIATSPGHPTVLASNCV
jgi:hypothetical protein